MTDRHQPATRGELCSHPLHPRAWDDPQDTPTPAGGPISPQIPGGPESGSPSSRPACSLSAGERGSPRAWSASLQWVEQAAGRPCPWGGSALGARPADAARVTAHTGRPHPLGSLMAGSAAQPGCPECLPCWSQHHLCRRKAALECVGGGLVLPGDVITAQLQGTSHWPSAHPKSFASASSWNFPQACSSRPWGSTLTSPQCPALSWKQQTGTSEGSADTRDLCAQGSPPLYPMTTFCTWHSCFILGRKTLVGSQQEGVTEFQLKWPESQRHPLLILPKQAQRCSVTGPALHSPGFGPSGPDVSPRGSGRWSSGPTSPGLSGTRDPSQAPPPPPAGGPLGPCCPHSPDHPGPVSQLRKTGLSASPTQWAWVRKWLQQGPPTEQVGPGAQLLLEAHNPGKCRSNHRDNKLRRSPLQPAKPALHQPAASLGGGAPHSQAPREASGP